MRCWSLRVGSHVGMTDKGDGVGLQRVVDVLRARRRCARRGLGAGGLHAQPIVDLGDAHHSFDDVLGQPLLSSRCYRAREHHLA